MSLNLSKTKMLAAKVQRHEGYMYFSFFVTWCLGGNKFKFFNNNLIIAETVMISIGGLYLSGFEFIAEEFHLLLYRAIFFQCPFNRSYGMNGGGMVSVETLSYRLKRGIGIFT